MATENTKSRFPRKHIINLVIFIAGIFIVTAAWPPDRSDTAMELTGAGIIVSSSFLVLFLFLSHFRKEILEVNRKTFFIVMVIAVFLVITRTASSYGEPFVLMIPFAIIPVIICTFYDARLALFTLMITLLLAGFMIPAPFEFIFSSFISGVAAIFMLSNIYRKGKIFFAALASFLSYCILHFALTLLHGTESVTFAWQDYEYLAASGMLTLLSYPVIFLFERNFYFLSDTSLLELSDLSNPLLRRFAEEAPGSFQHSLQVANLAEEAGRKVNANPLLARTGALYHDIGKILNAGYFIENQPAGNNPHERLDPAESAALITGHVREGVSLARKFKLPVQIIDFIRTHHGTTRTHYFYMKFLAGNNIGEDASKAFTYPGPKPFTRETAIVMMADAVEASSRTLRDFSEESMNILVEKIISEQERDDQFSDAPLTFRDLSEIKKVFCKRLVTIYHTRMVYPPRG
jgi:putative nucleotidyltransferase with HDIG domain